MKAVILSAIIVFASLADGRQIYIDTVPECTQQLRGHSILIDNGDGDQPETLICDGKIWNRWTSDLKEQLKPSE